MLIKKYIDETTIKILVDWAEMLYQPRSEVLFIPASEYRNRKTIFDIPQEVYETRDRIISQFKLEEFRNTNDIFFNALRNGQMVRKHKHLPHEGGKDLRFNIMLQKSQSGGTPVCEEITYHLDEGDLWVFNGNENHETDVVGGTITRYIISYGFIVPETLVRKLLKQPIFL